MKFGQSENPEFIDFRLPADDPRTAEILKQNDHQKPLNVYVGFDLSLQLPKLTDSAGGFAPASGL